MFERCSAQVNETPGWLIILPSRVISTTGPDLLQCPFFLKCYMLKQWILDPSSPPRCCQLADISPRLESVHVARGCLHYCRCFSYSKTFNVADVALLETWDLQSFLFCELSAPRTVILEYRIVKIWPIAESGLCNNNMASTHVDGHSFQSSRFLFDRIRGFP
jgi:hypothetical protein